MPIMEIWVGAIVLGAMGLVLLCSYIGKGALISLLCALLIVVNIASSRDIRLFGLEITLGSPVYAVTFLLSNVLSERYNRKEAHQAIWKGFVVIGLFVAVGAVVARVPPDHLSSSHSCVSVVLDQTRWILGASLVTYLIAQHSDVWLFWIIRKLTKERWLWGRNVLSTVAAEFVDSLLFNFLAFSHDAERNWVELAVGGFVIKSVIGLADTPFIYIARRIGSREWL